MKKSDVVIGMKVVPIRKSVGLGGRSLKCSVVWEQAKEIGQKFLYVIGERQMVRGFSLGLKKDSSSGDWFKPRDFRLYEGE